MPEVLMQQTSPYGTRRASVLRGDGDIYLYLEDMVGAAPRTKSAVWVANHEAAPTDSLVTAPPGTPARMAVGGTSHPGGCPPLAADVALVWFEEGDGVAMIDGGGVIAAVPGWAGRDGFYGYSRYAVGQSPLAWELGGEALRALEQKVTESRDFWVWRLGRAWPEIRATGLAHLEDRIGPQEAVWPVGNEAFPEIIATRHHLSDQDVWITATTGLSAQRMAGVDEFLDDADEAARIELVIARSAPDPAGPELLAALATVPFGRCTWLGEGHTIGGTVGAYPAFGADKAAILLTEHPPVGDGPELPDLSGLSRRSTPVHYLWVMVIDEATFNVARGRDARAALDHLASTGATWIH